MSPFSGVLLVLYEGGGGTEAILELEEKGGVRSRDIELASSCWEVGRDKCDVSG